MVCACVLQDGEWQEAWLAAERAEAVDAVAEALEGAQAWQPLDAGWAGMDLDDEPASPASRCALYLKQRTALHMHSHAGLAGESHVPDGFLPACTPPG